MPLTIEVVWALALPVRGRLDTIRIISSALSGLAEINPAESTPSERNKVKSTVEDTFGSMVFISKLVDFITCYTGIGMVRQEPFRSHKLRDGLEPNAVVMIEGRRVLICSKTGSTAREDLIYSVQERFI